MSHLKSILVVFLFFITILSCKKGDTGPQGDTGNTGPQGIAGPRGPQGISGNANVTVYTFNGPITMTIGTDLTLSNVTQARMDSSMVLAYYIPAAYSTDWYPIPGVGGYGTPIQYQTIYSLRASTGNKFILSLRLFNAGYTAYNSFAVVWNKIKVILAPASSIVPGGRQSVGTPSIDFSDYHAVVKYFNLTE